MIDGKKPSEVVVPVPIDLYTTRRATPRSGSTAHADGIP